MEFLPLSAYGAIGNDNRIALVSREGSIDWCPFPHLEDASVFTRILDFEKGGHFAIRPGLEYDAEQRYVERTNVLETGFDTASGRAVLTDFMPVIDGVGIDGRNEAVNDDSERADGGGDDATPLQEGIYRRLSCESGEVEFEVEFVPRFDYARADTTVERTEGGVVATGDDERLALHADVDFEVDTGHRVESGRATATGTLAEGDDLWFGLQYGHDRPQSADEYDRILEVTVDHWREWLDTCEESTDELLDGPWESDVMRSALVLKLLTHDESGAIPAAATTSLPEEVGGERNWDYRYNWIRDAKFTAQALYNVGQTEEAHEYFEWFMEIAHDDAEEIQPLYGLHGERDLSETELDHLSGYRDSTPVRLGNAAADQQQHDIYGTIVEGIYETTHNGEELSEEGWADVREIVDHVCEVWDTPDSSIWEFRDEPRHFVHSKLLCWVALDRGLDMCEEYGFDAPVERWSRERDAVREAIETRGYSEEAGTFVQHFESDEALDATALLIPIYDFLPGDDERVRSTIDAVRKRLTTEEGLVVRFVDSDVRKDERVPFVLCSFWLVDALVLAGRVDEAEEIFTNVLDRTTQLGLLSEKFDREAGEHLGNFPQAFSHIGLINSAIYLGRAREHEGDQTAVLDDLRAPGVDIAASDGDDD